MRVGQWNLGEVAMHLSQAWIAVPGLCEDAGAALSRASRADEAVPVLDEALDFSLRTGAQRGIARVEAALRALGVRRRRAGRVRRPSVVRKA